VANHGYELLQGNGVVSGPLIGGNFEVVDWLRGTEVWPTDEQWQGCVLFFETSMEQPPPVEIRYRLRVLGVLGVLEAAVGMVWGKPYEERYYEEYKTEIASVLAEFGREDMPVLYNLSFGHCDPRCVVPMGCVGQIDCCDVSFSVLESGVC
jgi:muramoyltetrapeptide carboxypeptidase LdcA involved in peptidoglycan recycling